MPEENRFMPSGESERDSIFDILSIEINGFRVELLGEAKGKEEEEGGEEEGGGEEGGGEEEGGGRIRDGASAFTWRGV